MSLALSCTIIAAAFLAVSAMAMEIAVRKRRSDQPRHWSDTRRIDPASPVPSAKTDAPRHRRRRTAL
jgi:hypothetical protein